MASIFDDLPTNPNQLQGTEFSFYDADTLYDGEGMGYRLWGVNALEVDKIGQAGQVGGELTTEQAVKLANDLGFTNVVKLGQKDSTGSREMIDLRDAQGRSFSEQLAASGLADPMYGFDPDGLLTEAAQYRQAMRSSDNYQMTGFDIAADELKEYLLDNNNGNLMFKQKRMMPGQQGDYIAEGSQSVFVLDGIDPETGEATSPLSTSWDVAMNGVSDAAYGMANLIGEKLGSEEIASWGAGGSLAARQRIAREGKVLTDYKDVDGFGDAVDFVANNVVMSLPYMAITAASMAAAPITGGTSLLAPVSIYTGQVWNEMGDQIKGTDQQRSAAIALGAGALQAALDVFGLKLVGIAGKSNKELFNQGVDALMKSQNLTKEAAEAQLANATKRELAKASGDIAKVAREQLDKKKLALDVINRSAKGGASEATTEAMQEAIAAIAADIGSESVVDWDDIQERAIQGAVAGGVLGGTFSSAGAIWDAGEWANLAYGVSPENSKDIADETQMARDAELEIIEETQLDAQGNPVLDVDGNPIIIRKARGYTPTIDENLAEVDALPDTVNPMEVRTEAHKSRKKNMGFKETITDIMTSTPALLRGSVRQFIPKEIQRTSKTARQMAAMFGGHLQKVYAGAHFENFKHHKLAEYKGILDIPKNVFIALNGGNTVFAGQQTKLSDKFYDVANQVTDKNGHIDMQKLNQLVPDRAMQRTYIKTIKQFEALAEQMYNDQKQYNPKLGRLSNYLLRYRALDKGAVNKDRNEFISLLRKIPLANGKYLTEAEAIKLTDEILNGESGTADEAFDVTKGGFTPGSHQSRTFNLSERKEFAKFMERDMFANVSQAAKSSARYVASQKYVGKNADKLAKMFDQMEREGVSQEEVDKMAYHMQNFLNAESGNYNRPTSDLGKSLEAIQKSFMVFVTITALPLAMFSSLVEVALTTRGLTKDQIFGTKNREGSLSMLGKELAETISNGMMEVARLPRSLAPSITTKGGKVIDRTKGAKKLRELGFYEWDVGAANTTGVTETHAWHTKLLDKFFKWTGLQGWTNFTRASRAAFAGDFIMDNAMIVMAHDKTQPRTNEVREAEEKLRNLGLPIHKLDLIMDSIMGNTTPAQEAEIAGYIREATFNFVNEAVALPQSSNRPLMYQDPRLALFMQFQGFMATFTANHIPRMWNEYIKRGSPGMKYQTFAMLTTMVMLGFASQYLKDLIKFGKSSPYLDEAELIQRGVLATGLMGTPERVFNQFFPIYETRSDGVGEWLWDTTSGESPTIGKAQQIVGATADFVTGDTESAAKGAARATLGPFYQPLKWAFEGDK